jgi:hypothetical protein
MIYDTKPYNIDFKGVDTLYISEKERFMISTSFFGRLSFALKLIFSKVKADNLAEKLKDKPVEKPLLPGNESGALQLLALLQKEGRLVDFVMDDVTQYSDAQVGAAARVVHQGVAKVINSYFSIEPVLTQAENTSVSIEKGFNPDTIRLTGNVSGEAPYKGTLIHRGWKSSQTELPQVIAGYDFSIITAAEVEL